MFSYFLGFKNLQIRVKLMDLKYEHEEMFRTISASFWNSLNFAKIRLKLAELNFKMVSQQITKFATERNKLQALLTPGALRLPWNHQQLCKHCFYSEESSLIYSSIYKTTRPFFKQLETFSALKLLMQKLLFITTLYISFETLVTELQSYCLVWNKRKSS